jgi:hypothetical protein
MKNYTRSNIKISYQGEPIYYINEKKRTVTCQLTGLLVGPQELERGIWDTVDSISYPTMPLSVTATARCHENDRFDVERGKRIALSKAENEIYNRATVEVSNVCEKLDFLRSACNDFVKKSISCQAHNIDYIDSLSVPAHPKYTNEPLREKRGTVVGHIKA